jgi:hypothetical protein
MKLTFTQCLWRENSELGHRFLCELSDIEMGIKTLLAMKDPAICQLKELSECGTSDCNGIKGLEDGRRSKYG